MGDHDDQKVAFHREGEVWRITGRAITETREHQKSDRCAWCGGSYAIGYIRVGPVAVAACRACWDRGLVKLCRHLMDRRGVQDRDQPGEEPWPQPKRES